MSQFNDTESYVSKSYRAKRAFDHGNFDVEHLLILGFILAHHENDQSAADSLWGIINPEINESVPKARVLKIVNMLLYYAIEVPHEVVSTDEKADASVIAYIEDLKAKAPRVRNDLELRLPDPVHKNEFLMTITPKWYSSYKIRAFVCPEKARA